MSTPPEVRRRLRCVAALAVTVATVSALAACSTGPQRSATRIDPAEVPFNLLEVPDAAEPLASGQSVSVFLEHEGGLVELDRAVDDDDLGSVLDALAAGPTDDERVVGLSSALPPGQVGEVSADRGVALVDLRDSFADLARADQVVAIAQIVFTLTGQPGIGRVSFTLEGESIELPRGDGALTTDALARDDFDEFAPTA